MPKVLFLCTGNYYRSRFAEILFNTLAPESGLDWTAFSRALYIEGGGGNIGPISRHTRDACRARNIPLPEPIPYPAGASAQDFAAAGKVIALKEAEHRALMRRKFPALENEVEYWHVHDLDAAHPDDACAQIERHVRDLIDHLRSTRG